MRNGYETHASFLFAPGGGAYFGQIAAFWDRAYLRADWQCTHRHTTRETAMQCAQDELDNRRVASTLVKPEPEDSEPTPRQRWLEDQ